MQLGMIGLGRMGGGMVRRLQRGGHACVVFDRDPAAGKALEADGATAAASIDALVAALAPPRAVWIMVPSGAPTESTVQALAPRLSPGDVVIDGGNSFYKDDARRAVELRARGVDYCDVGTSGGVWGLERGYCLMIGGPTDTVSRLGPIFATLAPGRGDVPRTPGRERMPAGARASGPSAEEGWLHCGPAGAGHFVKMIHNGIEYGLMQAYAEGFDILRHAGSEKLPAELRYDLRLEEIAEVWRRGSVVTSWLLDLTAQALLQDPKLESFSGFVQDSGEGRWTVQAAIDEDVPADVLTSALYTRFRSRQEHTFAEKVLSAMRKGFGGHQEPGAGKKG